MTVSYTFDVANGSSFGCFWKILKRWRGSVYKLVWRELLAYLLLYYVINIIYRYGLSDAHQRTFEKVKVYCKKQSESIPMSFVLGFYVTLIVRRWWEQYRLLPWPDSLALFVSSSLEGQDERSRILRRTIVRYAMMAYVMALMRISFRVKKRFPTLQHLVDAGLMTDSEKKILDAMQEKVRVSKYWVPLAWAGTLVHRARKENRIRSDHMVQSLITEVAEIRRRLGRVMSYDTISVPLVYTQVVTLAVYTYFMAEVIGRQWVSPPDPSTIYPHHELDLYFPIFTTLQFAFYIGWLKVAETLINPFGEDDDDFELNWLIDRHLQVAYIVVDEMHDEHPELMRDQYFEEVIPQELPYTVGSEHYRKGEPSGSTAYIKIKDADTLYANLAVLKRNPVQVEEVYADYESVDSPLVEDRKNWLQRQLSGLGSFRSTSSANSSVFGRPRLSVTNHLNNNNTINYNNNNNNNSNSNNASNNGTYGVSGGGHRRSLYERLLHRKSPKDHAFRMSDHARRSLKASGGTKPNGMMMHGTRWRPRVPTPEVAKDIPEKQQQQQQQQQAPRQDRRGSVDGHIYTAMDSYPPNTPNNAEQQNTKAAAALAAVLSPIQENENSPYSSSSQEPSPEAAHRAPFPPPLLPGAHEDTPDTEEPYSTIEEEQEVVKDLKERLANQEGAPPPPPPPLPTSNSSSSLASMSQQSQRKISETSNQSSSSKSSVPKRNEVYV